MKVLIVEDDQATSQLLSVTLTENRYVIDLAQDGITGLELAQAWEYDLILLDVNLPRLDGIQVCRKLRSRLSKTPILMLTAQERDEDVITGLDAGADDYVIKPCNLDQLLARIRSLLRRSTDIPSGVLEWGGIRLDPVTNQVSYRNREVLLRLKEYTLLELLLRHPQRVFSRSIILDHLWTADKFPTEGAVTNLIKDLRQRLAAVNVPEDFIQTLHGIGYRLNPLFEKQSKTAANSQASSFQAADNSNNSIQALTAEFQTSAQQRVSVLQATVKQLLSDLLSGLLSQQVTQERQHFVKQEVHRLAGSLGLYGYPQASAIARSLDRLLEEHQFGEISGEVSNKISGETSGRIATVSLDVAKQLVQGLAALQQELEQPDLFLEQARSPLPPLVLVVSEDDHWVETLQQNLQNWNLRIQVIADWLPAQQRFVLETPAAIVLDGRGRGDAAVLLQVAARYPALPVLLLTDQDNPTRRIAASRSGCTRYLIKPVTPIQLFEQITALFPAAQARQKGKVLADDVLSQIPNRHGFNQILQQQWQRHQEVQSPLSLMLCDVDACEADRNGYTSLQTVARAIQTCLQPDTDRLTRYSRTILAIVLSDTSLSRAINVAERMQQAVAQLKLSQIPCRKPDAHACVSFNIGITGAVPTSEKTKNHLTLKAERALNAAKEDGQNTYCLYPL